MQRFLVERKVLRNLQRVRTLKMTRIMIHKINKEVKIVEKTMEIIMKSITMKRTRIKVIQIIKRTILTMEIQTIPLIKQKILQRLKSLEKVEMRYQKKMEVEVVLWYWVWFLLYYS